MKQRRFVTVLYCLLIACTLLIAPTSTSAEPSADCQDALDYLDRYIEEVHIPLQEEGGAGPFEGFRISRDWLLDNDPPTLFVPIHATLIDLYGFMLNESMGYLGSPEAVGTPIAAIMNRHLDDVHETYAACPELEQAMLTELSAATPSTTVA